MTKFISDTSHFHIVLRLVAKAKHTLWLGTADIKDLYISKERLTSLSLEYYQS